MATAEDYSREVEGVHSGNLEVRLAKNADEINAAQSLRYKVFYEEMSANPSSKMKALKRDFDEFDDYWDHLLVFDNSKSSVKDKVIGTYRLNRKSKAKNYGGFYTAQEYNIDGLLKYPGEILELGRSCVDNAYRNGQTMQLLWRGIANYVFFYDIEVMFGCASMSGTDPSKLALPLSYLYHYHLAPLALRPKALPERFVDMEILERADVNPRKALAMLAPLIKGYLRLGGFVGDGAVVDRQFNTTDVSIVVKTDLVTEKYLKHYERKNRRDGEEEGD